MKLLLKLYLKWKIEIGNSKKWVVFLLNYISSHMLSFLKCLSGSHRRFEPKGLKHTQLLLFKGLFICISNLFSVFYRVYSSKENAVLPQLRTLLKFIRIHPPYIQRDRLKEEKVSIFRSFNIHVQLYDYFWTNCVFDKYI